MKFLNLILILAVLAGGGWYLWQSGILDRPCAHPITYKLGQFDARFKISRQDFLNSSRQAETIWEKPTAKNLFDYSTQGKLVINLVYDYRQQATDRLRGLGLQIETSRESYDAMVAKYKLLLAQYKQNPSNELVDTINALVNNINRLAAQLNLTVANYNTIGASRGKEFESGDYEASASGTEINVYEFASQPELTRLLAHELGHALGLPHLDDKTAIMYRLNTSRNEKLSPADLSALKSLCQIK